MTEPTGSDKQPAGKQESPTASSAATSRSSSRPVVIALAILILMVAFGTIGAFYYWLQTAYEPERQSLGQRLAVVGERVDRVSSDVADAAAGTERVRGRFDSIEREQRELGAALEQLYAQKAQSDDGWQLKEVEYLLVMGNQRILLDRDVDSAIAALQSADARLRDIGRPALIPLRGQLTDELNALRSVARVDISGLALNLGNIVERVAQLPLDDSGIALLASEPAAEQARVEGWRGVLAAMWADLIGVIDIKQLNTPDAVLFDPDARQALYQNLRLDLASARLAVLRRDTDNLRVSLRLVNNLLSNYFDLDDQGVASVIETLEGMSQIELAPALPDIGGSLESLRQLMANKPG